ncbi:hypothetical protein JCM8547_001540 [Rhodosporidiobolus lusitaniae]
MACHPTRAKQRPHSSRTLLTLSLFACTPSFSSASFLSSSLSSLRNRALNARQVGTTVTGTTSSNSTASGSVTVVEPAAHQGRYGHSSFYLSASNALLILGGQLESSSNSSTAAPQVTSTALEFNLASTFLWGDRPVSAIPDNPSPSSSYSSSSAWAASAVDSLGQAWIFGGIAPSSSSCTSSSTEENAVAAVFSNETWSTPPFSPRTPPRRRQASAVPVLNATTGGTDVWVFGGIADEWTCSSDGSTVGYVGVDRWDTVGMTVESMAWSAPTGASPSWEAPVSDYAAAKVGENQVVVVGGQTAQGALSDIGSILVFDVASRSWTAQTVSGTAPPSRMGHVLVPLTSGCYLLHGGLSSSHSPLSDLFLLTPSNSSSSWSWTELATSDHSILSPALAWHTATLVPGETIVVAFGLDSTTATVSDDFWFLTVDEEEGTYTWQDTFGGNLAAVETSATSKRLAKKALEVVVNPKMSTSAAAASGAADEGYYGGTGSGATPAVVNSPLTHSSSSTTSLRVVELPSSSSSVSPSASSAASSAVDENHDSTSSKTTTAIAASLGAIGGAAALLGLAFLIMRRRAAQQGRNAAGFMPQSSHLGMMGENGGAGGGGNGGLKPVSTLLYTRPVRGRNMSLGSTISALGNDSPATQVEEHLPNGQQQHGEQDGLKATMDPFSDAYRVNELGQLERSGTASSSAAVVSGGSPMKASVKSIPFLSTIASAVSSSSSSSPGPSSSADVYTHPAPSLSAKRSLRRPSQLLPPLPSTSTTPHTPAELIGLAVTSDDGHAPVSAETDGLPYLRSESREDFVSVRTSSPARAASVGIPHSLRPGTPLKVTNPDPFAEQLPTN